jgi:hypothetical protein
MWRSLDHRGCQAAQDVEGECDFDPPEMKCHAPAFQVERGDSSLFLAAHPHLPARKKRILKRMAVYRRGRASTYDVTQFR